MALKDKTENFNFKLCPHQGWGKHKPKAHNTKPHFRDCKMYAANSPPPHKPVIFF